MTSETVARRYATAVYSLAAEAGAVDRIGNDLAHVVESIERDEETRQFFLAPIVSREEKERVMSNVFTDRIDEVALHTLLLLIRKHREALLGPILNAYRALERKSHGLEPLTLTSARPLEKGELKSIVGRLEQIYGKKFEAHLVVDRELIGGLRVTTGDRRVDGTIAARLEELSRIFAAQP
jgi:F-type H+-transporting ATPase subunit delta